MYKKYLDLMPVRGRKLRSIDKESAIDWIFIRLFKTIIKALRRGLDAINLIKCQTYRIKDENKRNEDSHVPVESNLQVLKEKRIHYKDWQNSQCVLTASGF